MMKKMLIVLLLIISSIAMAGPNMPDFQLKNLANLNVSIHSLTNGHDVTFLVFFTTWCSFCEKDIEGFQSLFQKYKDNGVGVVAISFDKKNATVSKYVNDKSLDYPVLMGSDEIASHFAIRGIPVTVVVDENNNVIEKIVGFKGPEYYENIIEQILKVSGTR